MFLLPEGEVVWRGEGELDIQSDVYYFGIGSDDYILVYENYHGNGDGRLRDLLVGNAIAPHQQVAVVYPKRGPESYVHLIGGNDRLHQFATGDFSVFRVIN